MWCTIALLGLISVICLLGIIACANEKALSGLIASYLCIAVLAVVVSIFTYLDTLTAKLEVYQATSVGEAKVLAIRQEAVKLGLATFKATPEGKVVFEWVNTNPTEKPLTSPK